MLELYIFKWQKMLNTKSETNN